jgi:hypothetical protein
MDCDACTRICNGCDSPQRLQFENAVIALKCDQPTRLMRIETSAGHAIEMLNSHYCRRSAVKIEAIHDWLCIPPMVLAGGEG